MPPPIVTITNRDWSLHRKGPIDLSRHNQKVKEAIKGDLPKIVGEEAIITADDKKIVKIPIRSITLPHFRYGDNKEGTGVGQGPGEPGEPVPGSIAGDQPGIDYYEADVTIEDIAALLFADLGLPYLKPRGTQRLESESIVFTDVRKKGPMSNLDKRRTVMENMRRNAMKGNPSFGGIIDDDLRFKTWDPSIIEETSAVVVAMRDVSGSMGEFEKYITRSFYFWMVRFLKTKYQNVDIVFITHHTDAKEVAEKAFFELGESGGTRVSSAYSLAQKIIHERYSKDNWNIYGFHFSDGDNDTSDNAVCVQLIGELLDVMNAFGYGEIHAPGRGFYSATSLMEAFNTITRPTMVRATIGSKEEVYPALQKFFSPDGSVTP